MFSGIIEKTAKVARFDSHASQAVLFLETGWKDLTLGESVAVNGVRLTVTELTPTGGASFLISPETLKLTQLSAISQNSLVNLERALTLQTRLSGHLVQGHVDGTAELTGIERQADCYLLRFSISQDLVRFCFHKGSIALNGISLTLNQVKPGSSPEIELMITPHTWNQTNLSQLKIGEKVNVEVDILSKMTVQTVERVCRN